MVQNRGNTCEVWRDCSSDTGQRTHYLALDNERVKNGGEGFIYHGTCRLRLMYFISEGSRPFICQVLFVIRWLIKVTVMLALFIISSELEYPCRTSETRAGVRDRQVSIRLGGRGCPPPHCSSPSPLPMHMRATIQ